MKMTYVYIIVVVIVIGGIVFLKKEVGIQKPTDNSALSSFDVFAQCLSDAGAKFYGAYWCPHCQAQKKLLQNSKKLPYIECSLPNGKDQTKVCIDAKITGYPTWEFADGSRGDGEQTLQELSDKTKCTVPAT